MKRSYIGKKSKRGGKSNSQKRSIHKRAPPTNRCSLEKPSLENVGTSSKKLSPVDPDEFEVDAKFNYRILDFLTVFTMLSQVVVCKKCKSDITFTESGMRGLEFKLVVSCNNCDSVYIPSSPYIEKGHDINRRIILAMRLLGVGLNGIIKFCAFMELPRPIFQSFYDRVIKRIAIGAQQVCERSMKTAAQEEKVKSEEEGQKDGITVSGDGSWRKRGFSSLFGFISLIGWFTGKVVDVLVKSKYCKACEFWKKKTDTEEYNEWAESHVDECQANHEASAGKMEVDAVVEMFERSESLHGMVYPNYVGDGDSKTFKGLLDAHPYENITVQKKESIDHVQKRMGIVRDFR